MNRPLAVEPIAIVADDEDLGRSLLVESALASGLKALEFDNGPAALDSADRDGHGP
jgi:hypothetical protein